MKYLNLNALPANQVGVASTIATQKGLTLEGRDTIRAVGNISATNPSMILSLVDSTKNASTDGYTIERLVPKTEKYIATALRILVKKQGADGNAGTLRSANFAEFGYADEQEFTTAIANEIRAILKGRFEIKQGSNVVMRETAADYYNTTQLQQKEVATADKLSAMEQQFIPLTHPVVIDGGSTTTINFTNATGKFDGVGTDLQLVFEFDGFDALDASQSALGASCPV